VCGAAESVDLAKPAQSQGDASANGCDVVGELDNEGGQEGGTHGEEAPDAIVEQEQTSDVNGDQMGLAQHPFSILPCWEQRDAVS
jgi:hypothetical protein